MLNEADLIVYLYHTTVLHFPEVAFPTTFLELSFIVNLDLAEKKKTLHMLVLFIKESITHILKKDSQFSIEENRRQMY